MNEQRVPRNKALDTQLDTDLLQALQARQANHVLYWIVDFTELCQVSAGLRSSYG